MHCAGPYTRRYTQWTETEQNSAEPFISTRVNDEWWTTLSRLTA